MDPEEALAAITVNAARIAGLDETLDLEERARQAASKILPADRKYTPDHMPQLLVDGLRQDVLEQLPVPVL